MYNCNPDHTIETGDAFEINPRQELEELMAICKSGPLVFLKDLKLTLDDPRIASLMEKYYETNTERQFLKHHDELVRRTRRQFERDFGFAGISIHEGMDAEDIVMNAWCNFVRSIRHFNPDLEQSDGWIVRIVERQYLDVKRLLTKRISVRSLHFLDIENIPCLRIETSDRTKHGDDESAYSRPVRLALRTLSENQRRLIKLVYIGNMNIVTAAKEIGISPTNARVSLHRARIRLCQLLSEFSHLK